MPPTLSLLLACKSTNIRILAPPPQCYEKIRRKGKTYYSYLQQYLSRPPVSKCCLQICGTTAAWKKIRISTFISPTSFSKWTEITSLYKFNTAQKISFPLRISSVNVTKCAVDYGSGHIHWRNPESKTSFFVKRKHLLFGIWAYFLQWVRWYTHQIKTLIPVFFAKLAIFRDVYRTMPNI